MPPAAVTRLPSDIDSLSPPEYVIHAMKQWKKVSFSSFAFLFETVNMLIVVDKR